MSEKDYLSGEGEWIKFVCEVYENESGHFLFSGKRGKEVNDTIRGLEKDRSLKMLIVMEMNILKHRKKCKGWKTNTPCKDCCFGAVGNIIEKMRKEL